MAQTVQVLRSTVNAPPAALLPGVFSVELAAQTRLWVGAAGGNRLLLSSDPADTAIAGKTYLPLAGGTLTGPLLLAANPSAALGAATKQYVDAADTTIRNTYLPLAGGAMTGPLSLAADPAVALGAATKQYVDTAAAKCLPLAGGTLTGPLILAANPAVALGAVPKQYVDARTFTLSGDVTGTGTTGAITAVVGLQGRPVSATPPGATQVLQWSGVAWTPATPTLGTVTAITAGNGLTGGTISSSGTIALSAPVTIANGGTGSVSGPAALAALGAVAKAGDSMSGGLTLNGGGWALYVPGGGIYAVGTSQFDGGLNLGNTLNVNAGAINVPNGNAAIGGALTVGGAMAINGMLTAAGGANAIDVVNGNLQTISLSVPTGNAFKPGGGTWLDLCDTRTKKSVSAYTRGLDAVLQLEPVSFQHNGRGGSRDDGKFYVGLIANDVLPVMPEMVHVTEQKLDPDDPHVSEILALEATALIYALVNAVKELSGKVAALSAAHV